MEDIIKSLGVTVNDEPSLVVTHKKNGPKKDTYVCMHPIHPIRRRRRRCCRRRCCSN